MWKKKQVKNDPEWIENKTLLLLPNKLDPDQPSNEKITWFGQLYLPNQKLQNSKKKVPIPWRQKILEIPIHFCVTTQKNKEILNGKLHFFCSASYSQLDAIHTRATEKNLIEE